MREFYQFEGTGSPGRSATAAKRADGPADMDLDSEVFDVQKYTTSLLQRESLKGLVEADTDLLRKVRCLDGELQDLVYKNYSKFISATDTIRQMKENVSDMDSKLKALSSNVSNIDTVSRTITDNLQSHRTKLEEMLVVNKMLRKVHFLLELPERMGHLIDLKNYHTAVKFWVAGDAVLRKYQHMSTFTKTRESCTEIANELYRALEASLASVSVMDPESLSTARKHIEDMRLLRSTSIFCGDGSDEQFYIDLRNSILDACKQQLLKAVEDSVALLNGYTLVSTDPPSLPVVQLFHAATDRLSTVRNVCQLIKAAFSSFTTSCEHIYDLVSQLEDSDSAEKLHEHICREGSPILDNAMNVTFRALELMILRSSKCIMVAEVGGMSSDDGDGGSAAAVEFSERAENIIGCDAKCLKVTHQCFRAIATSLSLPQSHVSHCLTILGTSLLGSVSELLQYTADSNAVPSQELVVAALVGTLLPDTLVGDISLTFQLDDQAINQALRIVSKKLVHNYVVVKSTEIMAEYALQEGCAVSKHAQRIGQHVRKCALLHKAWFSPSDATAIKHDRTLSTTSTGSVTVADSKKPDALPVPALRTARKSHQHIGSDADRTLSKATAILSTSPSRLEAVYITEALLVHVAKALQETCRWVPRVTTKQLHSLQCDLTFLLVACRELLGPRDQIVSAVLQEALLSAVDRSAGAEAILQEEILRVL